MAETFLAVRRGPGGFEQRVCVKRILPAFEQDAAFVQQFLQEARVSANLRHANIVQVLDFGVALGSHYLALELVEGMDLYRLLRALEERGETMTSGLVVQLAVELGTALDYAHHLGSRGDTSGAPVVHRDISPSNVLVSRAGEVKLTDFGIAKAVSSSAALTTTGVVKGKVPYMAPEYALSGHFDARSDLFALGVLLFESLAGRRPYVGATDLDTLQRILEGRRPSLAELCPSAPTGLVAAIEKMLSPKPEERFQSAAELLDALVDVAPPPTARRILGDLVRRLDAGSRPPASGGSLLPEGTAPISDAARRPSDPEPAPAGPQDRTRTRVPRSHEAPPTVRSAALELEGDRPSSSPAHTATLVGPRLAAELTDPHRGAEIVPPRASDREPSGTTPRPVEAVRPPEVTPTPRRSSVMTAIAIGGIAGLAMVGIAGAIALSGSGAEEPTLAGADPIVAPVVGAPAPQGTSTAATTPTAPDAGRALVAAAPRPDAGATTTIAAHVDAPPSERAGARPRGRHRDRTRHVEAPATPATAATTTAATTAASPEPVRAEPGTLRVVVLPFGEVWIDGDHVGSAPITRTIAAGPHLVEAGPTREARTMRRSVEIRSGEQESVVLR